MAKNSILEYIAFPSVSEAGEEQDQQGGGMPGSDQMDPSMMGGGQDMGMPQDGPMGGDPGMMGGDPTGGQGMPQDGGGEAQPPQGFAPQGGQDPNGFDAGLPGMDGQPQQGMPGGEEEEVIDVEDLTNAQDNIERKVDDFSSKFTELLDKLGSLQAKIDDNNANIDRLKSEMEKRNPTPVEKMTLRSKDAYPFNVSPDEYWKDKEQVSNYSTEDDNNGADDPVYQITKSDVDDIANWPEISKTLDDFHKMSLNDILDL